MFLTFLTSFPGLCSDAVRLLFSDAVDGEFLIDGVGDSS